MYFFKHQGCNRFVLRYTIVPGSMIPMLSATLLDM